MNAWRSGRHDVRSRLGQTGLTLLEVLISLMILSVLAVIAVEAFRLGSRSWERQQRGVEAEERIRVIYGVLAREMASVQPVTTVVDGARVRAFRGWADRVFFYTAPDRYRRFPYNAMVRGLSFFVDPEKGLVVQESYPLVEGEVSLAPRGKVKVVDRQVTRIGFRYLVPPEEDEEESRWVERWEPVEGSEVPARPVGARSSQSQTNELFVPAESSGLPLLVEVTVAIADERKESEVTFVLPIHVGRYLAA